MTSSTRILAKSAAVLLAFTLVGCTGASSPSDDLSEPPRPGNTDTAAPSLDPEPTSDSSNSEDDDCFIHLFDSDNFDEDDDNFRLTEPGKYENLDNLPGAEQGWTDEADSVRVGDSATVIIYSETDFSGESVTLDPGSEHPDLDPEPSSLEMTCE